LDDIFVCLKYLKSMTIDLTKYKNIIFDLGGVILNIDYELTAAAFKKIGLDNFQEYFSKAHQKTLFDLYEKGLISSAEFRQQLEAHCDPNVDNHAIDHAWNAMLLDLPAQRLELLKELKQRHRTFLLSNTNAIHIDTLNNYLHKQYGIADLSGYFEKMYLSYEVKMRKPDAEIFELVLTENNLDPKETLFIDDSIQHIESAKKIGIQTYWLDVKKEGIVDLFA
jgi:HAD superfamily hydrolase (TIGR01509 family)